MTRLVLLLACACNQVYGLDATQVVDAKQPRIFSCPEPGPATFSPKLYEVDVQNGMCVDYTVSRAINRAVARCIATDATGMITTGIAEGPIDGPLAFTNIIELDKFTHYVAPRISPDGQRLYVMTSTTQFERYQRYARTATGWQDERLVLPFVNGVLSTIATAPTGDRVLFRDASGQLQEYVDAGGFMPVGAPITLDDLKLANAVSQPSLSSDGLRLLVTSIDGSMERVFYAERPSASARFGRAVRFPGVPAGIGISVLTDDCARVYLAGLDRIFYVEQQ